MPENAFTRTKQRKKAPALSAGLPFSLPLFRQFRNRHIPALMKPAIAQMDGRRLFFFIIPVNPYRHAVVIYRDIGRGRNDLFDTVHIHDHCPLSVMFRFLVWKKTGMFMQKRLTLKKTKAKEGWTMRTRNVLLSYWRWPPVLRLFVSASALIVLFGALMRFIEPETFRTVFDGVWWAIVTSATIGYGDIVPKTAAGKLAAIGLIILGTGILTAYFASVSAAAAARETAFTSGQLRYTERGHAVIVGWNERAREVLLRLARHDASMRFVLIDATVPSHPLLNAPVHFIKGTASDDAVLEKANIQEARFLLITADPHKAEAEADKDTIVTLLAAKSLNPSVYAIVEILTGRNVQNAFRAGADEVIQTNLLASFALAASLRSPGAASVWETALYRLDGQTLCLLEPDEQQIGQPFAAVQQQLLKQNVTLLGVIHGDHGAISVAPDRPIQQSDRLFALAP